MAANGNSNSTQLLLLDPTPRATAPARRPARTAGAPHRAERTAAIALQPELQFTTRNAPLVNDAVHSALERRLRMAIGAPLSLTITDNRRTMLSIQRRGSVRRVRLHHMFVDATPEVIDAVGRYLSRGDRFASKLIDRYIADNQARIKTPAQSPAPRLEPRGMVYDLAEIQTLLSEQYFGGLIDLAITWGRHGTSQRKRRTRRTIRMGTYFIDEQLIRIHPALDQQFVPRYFVEWVVYHEMLHHVVPMPLVKGRRVYHSAEFRSRERQYSDYERARAWEEQHLRKLIASRARVVAVS